jgi:serine/threonine-protein kinase
MIEVLTLADGRRKTLVRGGQSPHYVPSSDVTGHLVYTNNSTLFAIRFDPATLETHGTAVPVLDDVAFARAATGAAFLDVSRTGTLIYRRSSVGAAAMTTVQWLSPSDGTTGKREPLRPTPGAYDFPRLSPDGTRIALDITEGANSDVWVDEPQRDALTRLTFGGVNYAPAWSPDGQYVVFAKRNEGIFQARADGASHPQTLTRSNTNPVPWSFSPDGKRLAYFDFNGAMAQISTVPLEDQGSQLKAGAPEPFLKSNSSDVAPSFSPDGRWLAYYSNESGRNEVYVRAFSPPSSGQGGKWQISNDGGVSPRWSRTGHELVYQAAAQLMTVSYSVNGDTFIAEKPRVWIAALGADLTLGGYSAWDLAPDGKRVAVVVPERSARAAEHVIVMLQNFADELRRRVPLRK